MERHRSRRSLLRGLGAGGVLGMTGCLGRRSQETQMPTADVNVRITEERFEPPRIEVSPGETVTWLNEGNRIHTVTADEDRIPSVRQYFASGGFQREISAKVAYPLKGGLEHGERYEHTFEQPGTYGYYSIPLEDENMKGIVVVTEP